jgi:hypothetical protein
MLWVIREIDGLYYDVGQDELAMLEAVDVSRIAHAEAHGLGVVTFTHPADLCCGSLRLVVAFAAQIFDAKSGFESVEIQPLRANGVKVLEPEVLLSNEPWMSAVALGVGDGGSSGWQDKTASACIEAEEVEALPCGERVAFARYINNVLEGDPVVADLVPLDVYSGEMFERVRDGRIVFELATLLDAASSSDGLLGLKGEGLSDEERRSNVEKALAAAALEGCEVSQICVDDIVAGRCVS